MTDDAMLKAVTLTILRAAVTGAGLTEPVLYDAATDMFGRGDEASCNVARFLRALTEVMRDE